MRLQIVLGALSQEHEGFGMVVVPDIPEKLYCPKCGAVASNDGLCKVRFELHELPSMFPLIEVGNEPKKKVLALAADCEVCGYYGPGPTNKPPKVEEPLLTSSTEEVIDR